MTLLLGCMGDSPQSLNSLLSGRSRPLLLFYLIDFSFKQNFVLVYKSGGDMMIANNWLLVITRTGFGCKIDKEVQDISLQFHFYSIR